MSLFVMMSSHQRVGKEWESTEGNRRGEDEDLHSHDGDGCLCLCSFFATTVPLHLSHASEGGEQVYQEQSYLESFKLYKM